MGAAQRDALVRGAAGLQGAAGRGSRRQPRADTGGDRTRVRSRRSAETRRLHFCESLPMRARVFVTLKPSVFDPQGRTIAEALHSLGYSGVDDVRQGKYFELDLATTEAAQAKALASEVADKLLANPVIESYRIEID